MLPHYNSPTITKYSPISSKGGSKRKVKTRRLRSRKNRTNKTRTRRRYR